MRGETPSTHQTPERIPQIVNASKNQETVDESRRRSAVLERHRKERRLIDAYRYVDTAVKAAGGTDAVREQIRLRLEETDRRIDALAQFDPKLQEEREFLEAQRTAVEKLAAVNAASREKRAIRQPEVSNPVAVSAAEAPKSFFGRIQSRWNSLKQRLFGFETQTQIHKPGAPSAAKSSRYEQTWTPARLAQRDINRTREMELIQANALFALEQKLIQDHRRLEDVTTILTRNRRTPMPARTRAKYVSEVQAIEARIQETERLQRIAEATAAIEDLKNERVLGLKKAA
jgi:hypothetical protein